MRKRTYVRVLAILAVCYTSVGFYMWYGSASISVVSDHRNIEEQPIARNNDLAFTPVVVVAYMRSGSSLTGNIIQQDPDTFYVFEPLHDLINEHQKEKEKQFPNQRFHGERPLMIVKEEVEDLFRAWFTCDMEYVLSELYRYHIGFFKFGYKTQQLMNCLNNTTNKSYDEDTLPCTNFLRNLCLESRYRVLKTIRTPLNWLKGLMDEYPTMKIVHLVRDPRAILTSQHKFGECSNKKHGGLAGCAKFLCSNLEDDLATFEMFSELYPSRTFRLKFEDIALKPLTITKELYKFLNLKYTDATQKYVVDITMSGNNASFTLDTVRPNSTAMIDKWRTKISDELLDTVQIMCGYVMKQLSYYHFIKPV